MLLLCCSLLYRGVTQYSVCATGEAVEGSSRLTAVLAVLGCPAAAGADLLAVALGASLRGHDERPAVQCRASQVREEVVTREREKRCVRVEWRGETLCAC